MRLFVLCLYFLFLVFSLHVSGLHGPIIRGISNCCFYATIWFMHCKNQMVAKEQQLEIPLTMSP